MSAQREDRYRRTTEYQEPMSVLVPESLEAIRKLVEDGFTIREIVDAMNTAEYPTARVATGSEGSRWHIRTVQLALKQLGIKTKHRPFGG